ncbi:MAG: hypothetical protein ACOY4F_12450 [Thermodesulfobacteriota bacterium]
MAQPMKLSFTQDVMETSPRKLEILGARRVLADGRVFRYAKAGAGGVAAGKLVVAGCAVSAHVNLTAPEAAVGQRVLTLTLGAAAAAENAYEDGYLQVNAADGQGHQYRILSNAACAASGQMTLTLAEPLRAALTAASRVTLVASPWSGVASSDQEENLPVGIAPCDAAEGRHFWSQTGGPALYLAADASVPGTMLVPSSTAGALAGAGSPAAQDKPITAVAWATAGAAGQYKPCYLVMD